MRSQQKKKLQKLLNVLDEAQGLARELLNESTSDGDSRPASEAAFDAASYLSSLKALDRSSAESKLGELKQHELGAVFIAAGGPATDKTKPKVWLVEQILWRAFDFERGHKAIRSKRADAN